MEKQKKKTGKPAPKGNKYAEKWTEEAARELFKLVYSKLEEETYYNVNGKNVSGYLCHFLGEACDEAKTTIDIIRYLRDKYGFSADYERLKRKSERNSFTDTKRGIINTAAGIINLKSNHSWTDRLQQDVTTQGDKIEARQIIVSSTELPDKLKGLQNDLGNE